MNIESLLKEESYLLVVLVVFVLAILEIEGLNVLYFPIVHLFQEMDFDYQLSHFLAHSMIFLLKH